MDSDEDIKAINGLLNNVAEKVGSFANLKYQGGNEKELHLIAEVVKEYLSSKFYMGCSSNENKFNKNVENIVLCFIVNTDFQKCSFKNHENLRHLVDLIPLLTKCILTSIIIELGLSKVIPRILSFLTPEALLELVDELIIHAKRVSPEQSLQPTMDYLKSIILVFSILKQSSENEEILDKLSHAGVELARGVARVNPDLIEGWNSKKIYNHMGYTLINLLRLLQICNEENSNLKKLINGIISSSIFIMNSVSVDVFCIWAETTFEGQPLQACIAFDAYRVVDKYSTFAPSKKLVHMLMMISRKPKSLREVIFESDVETVVDRINETDADPAIQKQWFAALLNTDVFANKQATKCLMTYCHLCSDQDVYRILNLSRYHNDLQVKKIALDCAKRLESSKLNSILTRLLYEYETTFNFSAVEDIDECVNSLLQKYEDEDLILKEILILLLQEHEKTLRSVFKKCLEHSNYTDHLNNTFRCIKSIAEVNSVWVKVFQEIFNVTNENLDCYIKFVNMLIRLNYISFAKFSEDFLLSKINVEISNENYENLVLYLKLLHDVEGINSESTKLVRLLLETLNKTRCKFLEFCYVKQQCAKLIVDILIKISQSEKVENDINKVGGLEKINKYYLDRLKHRSNFLVYLFPNIHGLKYGECISRLIQILPQCVEVEWKDVFESLNLINSTEKTCEMFTDVLLLLCQLVTSQSDKESEYCQKSLAGLKYCLEIYGNTLEKCVLRDNNVEIAKIGCKNICRLLKYLPQDIKEEEGLKLTEKLTDNALKQLANDEFFVYSLAGIENTVLSQTIAKRVIS